MNLNPECCLVKSQVVFMLVLIISLKHHQVFVKTPRLICNYSIHSYFVIKNEKNNVITKTKSFLDLHNWLKVLATDLVFKTLFVKNFAVRINSSKANSLRRWKPLPSWSERDSKFQPLVISSMVEKERCVSQTPKEKRTHKPYR